jgi:hypothetical protein
VTLALAAGCGGDEEASPADERSAIETARDHVGTRDAAETRATAVVEGNEATVTLLFDRMRDDSTRAERNVLTLERVDDGPWRVVENRVTRRCWPNRGHQDFSEELCL